MMRTVWLSQTRQCQIVLVSDQILPSSKFSTGWIGTRKCATKLESSSGTTQPITPTSLPAILLQSAPWLKIGFRREIKMDLTTELMKKRKSAPYGDRERRIASSKIEYMAESLVKSTHGGFVPVILTTKSG